MVAGGLARSEVRVDVDRVEVVGDLGVGFVGSRSIEGGRSKLGREGVSAILEW